MTEPAAGTPIVLWQSPSGTRAHFDGVGAEPETVVSQLDDGTYLLFFQLRGDIRGRVIVDVYADRDIATLRSRGKYGVDD